MQTIIEENEQATQFPERPEDLTPEEAERLWF